MGFPCMEILKGTAQKLVPFISSKASSERQRCHLRSDSMMTDTLAFLLLLCPLSSCSSGRCIRTREYEKYMNDLKNVVKNCPEVCENIPEHPCSQCLNISVIYNISYFTTGLSQMALLNKKATRCSTQLQRRLKPCNSTVNWDGLQIQHLVPQKHFVEQLSELFKQLNDLGGLRTTRAPVGSAVWKMDG